MITNMTNLGSEAYFVKNPYLRLSPGASIINCKISGNLTIDKLSSISKSEIGKYFGLGCFSYITNSHIGRYCTFGARVSVGAFSHPTDWLQTHEFQSQDTRDFYGDSFCDTNVNIAPLDTRTTIGSDVWIGDNACVRTGVRIGTGAIIGMGAVITADVPDYAIMVGAPARVLRYRFDEETVAALLLLGWWELDMSDLKGVDFSDVGAAIALLRQRKVTRSI